MFLRFILFIFLLLLSNSAWASIALVNSSVGGNFSGSSFTTMATAALSTTTGNIIIVATAWSGGGTISGITDTAGNTYTQCTGAFLNTTGPYIATDIWYAKNITGNASNIATVTFTPSNTATFIGVTQVQYSGVDTSSPFETAKNGSGTNVFSVTSASFSPASSGNLNIATVDASGATTYTAGTNYATVSSSDNYVEDRESGTPSGSQTASVSSSNQLNLVMSVASFKPGSNPSVTTINLGSTGVIHGATIM